MCAERNALYSAISNGYKKEDFKELHVLVDRDKFSYPCFICRQAFVDFFNEDLPIFLYSNKKLEDKILVKDLIPFKYEGSDIL